MATCNGRGNLFLLIFLLHVATSLANFSRDHELSVGTKFELIHRHSLERNRTRSMTRLDLLKLLSHRDTTRQRAFSQRLGMNKPRWTNNGIVPGEMPISSAADLGVGEYFVSFEVGTPPQKFLLIADTGSDLTWMTCKYRCQSASCNRTSYRRPAFRPDRSSSFGTIPCSSRMCKVELEDFFSINKCPSPKSSCAYDYSYSDGSDAVGIFANEAVTMGLTNGRKARLANVLVGCTESSISQTFRAADGVIGLGYTKYSFALKAAEAFGGKFSYCLVDHLSPRKISSYLAFGNIKTAASKPMDRMQYTELLLGKISSFYAVNIKGISFGGKLLQIPPEVWNVNGKGGVVLDSGSSLTYLTRPAYQPLMAALEHALSKFPREKLGIQPMEYCFNSRGFKESMLPKLEILFTDGAHFKAPVKAM